MVVASWGCDEEDGERADKEKGMVGVNEGRFRLKWKKYISVFT